MVQKLNGHTGCINSVSFSPCGKNIVSGSRNYIHMKMILKVFSIFLLFDLGDNSIRVWEIESRKMVLILEGHTNSVSSVTFSSCGKYILSGSRNYTHTKCYKNKL